MSTDFFERQDVARRNTIWLIVMFLLALIAIVGTTATMAFLAADAYGELHRNQAVEAAVIASIVGAVTLAAISLGTLYKVVALRFGGGRSVAEAVGGLQLTPNAGTLAERRVMNVVEEMAIASGTPVPPVYLLEEPSINAFAAGYSPSDAVIGVTQGAVENLSRDQLQGVIAHEFSHILNGDMRMNIRLIGILHGILMLHLIGRMLLRMLRFSGRSGRNGKGGGQAILVMLAVGVVLLLLGWIGYLIGGMIKAAVSRQREYLADASAVQFTRNPDGIGGALKKIGALAKGSLIEHPGAEVASHMYFAKGVAEGFTGLMATHPPLEKRILAIDPNWDGRYPQVQPLATSAASRPLPGTAAPFATAAAEIPIAKIIETAETVGAPEEVHRQYAQQLVAEMDPLLLQAAREPYAARALVFALLLDGDAGIRRRQLQAIADISDTQLALTTEKLSKSTDLLADQVRLPLLDMTLPALRSMSKPQYVAFMRAFTQLAAADDRHNVFEWTLAQILIRHLKPHYVSVRSPVTLYYSLKGLSRPISILLSTLARVKHTQQWVQPSFAAGAKQVDGVTVSLLPASECTLRALHDSLKKLSRAAARLRGRLVNACAATIAADGHVAVQEAELLRGISDLLDCPVPPWVSPALECDQPA